MRRNMPVEVNATTTTPYDVPYELDPSPRSSVYTTSTTKTRADDTKSVISAVKSVSTVPTLPTRPEPPPQAKPSVRLLFSLLSQRHLVFLLLPAVLASVVAGGVAPFMTYVIGKAFDAFSQFPTTPNPPQEAKNKLLKGVGLAAIQLVALAVGSLALSSLTSTLWIWIGEINAMAVRKSVYTAVTQKDMSWFDTKMGAENAVLSSDGNEQSGPIGAGGLMAKFARETDDVRMASSLASGMLVQYLTTTITCLVLAFMRSWALTLVILSAVPILTFIQGLSQSVAGPLLAQERAHTASAATLIDRAIAGIATVKAFNAASHELSSTSVILDTLQRSARKLTAVWGATSGLAQFVMMSMFVQGFWFGSKLVREGTVSAGDVMAVFWACLIATSNLQMCIPQFIVLAKGKFAIASLLTLAGDDIHGGGVIPPHTPVSPLIPSNNSIHSHQPNPSKRRFRTAQLRKITPSKCMGELSLHNVTFAYPSRPETNALTNISIYLPANETTFIVGASGSGKSTIAQLLLRMYHPTRGMIQLDDQDVRYLDEGWMRHHISGVRQGECVIVDGSVWDNVILGLVSDGEEKTVTREEVEEACRAAMVHDFVRDLPDSYETRLGGAGVGLSGGQKQRLAIARARLRNPSVLILDEATSALDATSRILVFEALKRWRANKTTIVITHDLSQIEATDFVYVLKEGYVVEQGYRGDLENSKSPEDSEFCSMLESQKQTGGYLPEKNLEGDPDYYPIIDLYDETEERETPEVPFTLRHRSMEHPYLSRPGTSLANWMFEAVADLTSVTTNPQQAPALPPPIVTGGREARPISRFIPPEAFTGEFTIDRDLELIHALRIAGFEERRKGRRRPASISVADAKLPTIPSAALTAASRRLSLQFTPSTPVLPVGLAVPWDNPEINSATRLIMDDDEFEGDKYAVKRTAHLANERRQGRQAVRTRWDNTKVVPLESIKVDASTEQASSDAVESPPKFWILMRSVYPSVPHKPLVLFGSLVCLASGAMTPIFSYLLSRLLFEVSIGAKNVSTINRFGAIVLSIAALDGILLGTKYFIMEFAGMSWVTRVRKRALAKILAQDKKYFDKEENAPSKIVQTLVKDGDDARNLISVVIGQCLVVSAMLGVGMIWALVRGWQLTLAGVAIAPVFAGVMAIQSGLVAKCEIRNKRAREEVAQGYYESILNIRAIRSMAIEQVFKKRFDTAADKALTTGMKGAMVEGCTYGVASGLIYLAEALLFYVGAVLISKGIYTYLQMVEVLNLVVFSVTIGSQLMAFTQKIAKSIQATSDFDKLLKLSSHSDESRGVLRPPISGPIDFDHVDFTYPERPDAPVLEHVNLHVAAGECVAIVGPSGSGKSTVAALLQRLYEPSSGVIYIDNTPLHMINVQHLRDHVSVVSQNPNLFDASIAENIRYGNKAITDEDIRHAAQAAHVHEFIVSLPQGYDTPVGENAALISGGQAQRIQIARALARPASILVLDECTSALDPTNQAAVLETVKEAKVGRTTIMVTHKLSVMQMCNRIILVDGGEVKEEGTYEELMEKRGVFATLAGGGEWIGD
ncbi:hypothetical protein AMATHDRAFT_65547 [Amanita thiersii Skay4041]|uniref:P-loop containing nucleoside triphosphate hydrolase protein n=1 Tax=Amanita thiersii Skay4041 TaxID=703135 RepID=A0A2A9NL07_9AGAR|nr:hypothetical protein AMATHDRAFT_65547 [Amanita thiersii Skay4041]